MVLLMKYYHTDKPVYVAESEYHRILANIVGRLERIEGLEAIYQIGGISTPGISDLDLVLVFRDDYHCAFNLHEELNPEERYLFIHKLYACSRSLFQESVRFSFFHNFSLLAGKEIPRDTDGSAVDASTVKTQLALEYLVKMYANMIIQKEYGILQVRSLLLHGKALSYDLAFLGIEKSALNRMLDELLELRKTWFSDTKSSVRLENWFKEFENVFPPALYSILRDRKLYLSGSRPYKIAKNIFLKRSTDLSFIRKGILLPAFPVSILGKKYFRLQNKLNSFTIQVPFEEEKHSSILQDYFRFQKKHLEYNRSHLPSFYPLTSSLLS